MLLRLKLKSGVEVSGLYGTGDLLERLAAARDSGQLESFSIENVLVPC
jgi:hypothetical protein